LIDDNFGTANGEAFAADGWGNFAPFFGLGNIETGDWLDTLSEGSYLWGYACGGGTYTSADGVATTADFAVTDTEVVFTMLFGSYFGDWDSQDNFMRAQLGTSTYSLTAVWAGRPWWEFHHMALGETIGFSTLVTQNNNGLYSGNPTGIGSSTVQIALMGDPTLRMHAVLAPSDLTLGSNDSGGVVLNWNPSAEPVAGYLVFGAPAAVGPFTQLTPDLINETNYIDPTGDSEVYMVRAVKLESSASGTYYNPSQGIFQSLNAAAITPNVTLLLPTNNSFFISPANIRLAASVFDPANAFTNIVFYANGSRVGQASGPLPYSFIWSNVNAGAYSLTASATSAGGAVAASGLVNIIVAGTSPILTISAASNGVYSIGGSGIPSNTNRIEFSGSLPATNWQTLGTVIADPFGAFQITDSNLSPQRFYRTVFP
jgi:hypothetical protein